MNIRTLLIWGVVALVLVVLFTAMNGGSDPARGVGVRTERVIEQK